MYRQRTSLNYRIYRQKQAQKIGSALVALSIATSTVALPILSTAKNATADEKTSRQEQVATTQALIDDINAEQQARESYVQEEKIQQIIKQAEEELAKRQSEAEAQEEAIEINAGNMAKNQKIDDITGNGALSKVQGVNNYNGRRETWYSSRVARHYRTGEWTADENGVYRDSEGYVVIASSDHAFGTVLETSHGTGKVYDTGCASGTTDIYVTW